MAYPRWLALINKRLFNPRAVRKGEYAVVSHVGRSSGAFYQTPLDAHPTQEGYVLVVRYGPQSDWVKNILAAGTATLRVEGEEFALQSPHLVSQAEAVDHLAAGFEPPDDFFKAEDYLLMERAG